MKIPFSYSEIPALEVPEKNVLAMLMPRTAEPASSGESLAEAALEHPLGCPPIENEVSPSARILVLVDDITRQTPAGKILPPLFKRLAGRRVQKKNVKILIAAGTHALYDILVSMFTM